MSKRYIDADAQLSRLPDDLPYKASAKRVLIQAPTADVVEVVRCKDCRLCKYNTSVNIYMCDRRGYYAESVKPTDYCSYGERREENEG